MTTEQKDEYDLDPNFIDDVLDEFDESDHKSKLKHSVQPSQQVLWDRIAVKCKDNEKEEIEHLLKTGQISITDTDSNGNTLLIIAAECSSDIVQFCINYECDIDAVNDKGETALDRARFKGQYHIMQLLLLAKMQVSLQIEIKNTAETIQRQNGINCTIRSELAIIGKKKKEFFDEILMEMIINQIKKRLPFCDNLLIYCWDVSAKKYGGHGLSSNLWKTISSTCSNIICNRDTKDWYWFKTCLLTSTIWYRSYSNDDAYLYYQLLALVDNQAKNQLDQLEQDLNILANKNKNDWNKLIKFSVKTDYNDSNKSRQDAIPNGIISPYSLSQLVQASGYAFNAADFYDYNQYLSQLVLTAQMCDAKFQKSIQNIFFSNKENKGRILYSKGPVKLAERARTKASSDYIDESFPTSACVIDFNRCALTFNDTSTLLEGLKLFINAVRNHNAGTIIDIVRCKNGFIEFIKEPCCADVKLNVIIAGQNRNIIGEVQFLLRAMKLFKEKAHNLYSIQRRKEEMDNSVTQLLPMLLNQDQSLAIAGTIGSTKSMLKLIVWYNFTGDNILKPDAGGRNVLYRICRNNNVDLLKFLKSVIPSKQFIRSVLLDCDIDSSCIETSIWFSRSDILKNLFNMDEIRSKYLKDEYMFRLLDHMFVGNEKETFIEYLLNELNISKQKVQAMMSYQFPANKVKPLPAHQWDRYTIGTRLVFRNGNLGAVKRCVNVIGKDVFEMNVFHANGWNLNILECAIKHDKLLIIEYILSFKKVKDRYMYCNDNKLLYRLIYCIFGYSKPQRIDWILQKLQISENTIRRLVNVYKYPEPKKKLKQKKLNAHDLEQYHLMGIIGKAVCSNSLGSLQRLAKIIGDKMFNEGVFKKDGLNKNALQYSVQENKLDILQYMMNRKEIKNKIVNGQNELYGMILEATKHFNQKLARYIVTEFDVSETMLNALHKSGNDVDMSLILNVVKADDQ